MDGEQSCCFVRDGVGKPYFGHTRPVFVILCNNYLRNRLHTIVIFASFCGGCECLSFTSTSKKTWMAWAFPLLRLSFRHCKQQWARRQSFLVRLISSAKLSRL